MINQLIKKKAILFFHFIEKMTHIYLAVNTHTCTGDTLPLSTLSMLSPVFAPKNAEMIFKPVVKWENKEEQKTIDRWRKN